MCVVTVAHQHVASVSATPDKHLKAGIKVCNQDLCCASVSLPEVVAGGAGVVSELCVVFGRGESME